MPHRFLNIPIESVLLDHPCFIIGANHKTGGFYMVIGFLRDLFHTAPLGVLDQPMDAEYAPFQEELRLAGLSEETLRKMELDDRVAALEQAKLDPYDYIYLAC